ncbi:MAG: O-antigen ligase family protein [Romboutsia sp.]
MLKFFDIRIIYAFIFLQPILDLITSIMSRSMTLPLTVGIISRSLFMGYMFIYGLFIYRPKENLYKVFRAILIMIFIYLIVFIGFNFMTKELRFVITEAKGVVKLFYFPIVLMGLFIYNNQNKLIVSNKCLTYMLMIYTGTIFIATITGTYYRSYNDYLYGLGSIGWFFAANEIGSAIAILIPFTIVNFIQNKFNIINLASIALCIFVSLYIGTKVPFLGFVGSVGILFIYSLIQIILNRKSNSNKESKINYKIVMVSLIGMGLAFCILFYKSPVYKNIEFNYGPMIYRYIDKLKNKDELTDKIDGMGIGETIVDDGTTEEESIPKGNPHVTESGLDALLSNRDAFAQEVKNRFKNGTTVEKLIGIGHVIINIQDGMNTDKTIELDYQDIVYRHGIIGGALYFAPFIIIMTIIVSAIARNPRKLMDIDIFTYVLSLGLGLGIAGFAGHVLTAPGVSIYVIIPMLMLYNKVYFGDDINEYFNNNANL